jgi:hypothetical protein
LQWQQELVLKNPPLTMKKRVSLQHADGDGFPCAKPPKNTRIKT